MPTTKRRLPVLNAGADADAPSRPFWQWVAFAAAAIFAAWLPLSAIAAALASRLGHDASDPRSLLRAAAESLSLYGAAILLGAAAGGYVVGRWAPPGFGVRASALGGLGATSVAAMAAWASFGISAAPWYTAALAVPSAALGGWVGVRRAKGRPALPPL